MISQKCPKCKSKRVRRGYRRTHLLSKLICRYHLLCDNCNWEFVGFAVPGTVSSRPKRRKKKSGKGKTISTKSTDSINLYKKKPDPLRRKKKIKIKFD